MDQSRSPLANANSAAAPRPFDSETKRAIYVGNIPLSITDDVLREIFSVAGNVHSVKVIPDKNFTNGGLNYGFIEFDDPASAKLAVENLNGRQILDSVIKVNWAYQSASQSAMREETSSHFSVFVGDLAAEVSDEDLANAFAKFSSVSDARVMWDMHTGRSRGYGFVSFRERPDAEIAIATMNGEWLGSRAIRTNWANNRNTLPASPVSIGEGPNINILQQFEVVMQQVPYIITTVYAGNLAADTTREDLLPLFQKFGIVSELRIQAERGFAFAKMDTHENAAMAITTLQGTIVKGRPMKCSWQFKGEIQHQPLQQSPLQPPPSLQFTDQMIPVYPQAFSPTQQFSPPQPYRLPSYTAQQVMQMQAMQRQMGQYSQLSPGYP